LEPVVALNAISFLLAASLVALVRAPARTPGERTSVRGEWVAGLAVVRRDRTVAMLFWVLGLMTFGGTMLDPLYVAWVRDVLDKGPQVYGLLLTTHAVAGIAGALAVGRERDRLTPRVMMGWSSVVAGALLVVKFNVPFVVLT